MTANNDAGSQPAEQTKAAQVDPTSIDIRALDAQYKPIPPFSKWDGLAVDNVIWQRQVGALEGQRGTLSEADLKRASEVAVRAAAVDTGAIEGLYQTDRGLTLTIAVQQAAWETLMRARDPRLPDFFEAQLQAL